MDIFSKFMINWFLAAIELVKLATLIGFRSLKNAFWQRNDFFNSLSAFSCKKKTTTVNLIEMHATLVFTTLGPNC